ncbi:hypothetical protein HMN09_00915000 [Mycena chlorophos]|uniref:RTA1-domain-containing protein n=1 Tax=Mycena chlorophos TaxID=658473 RepID=A0A8H6W0C0_MYCCL|nr:hypothetical protein HMN09_00915000 [Mycena chlorophos]
MSNVPALLSAYAVVEMRPPAEYAPYSPYGYYPTQYVCALFVALFALSTVLHVGQAVRYRLWWLLPTACVAGLLEVLGWAARLWNAQNPFQFQEYEMQLVCTILGPTPLAAANFVILEHIIRRLGPEYSRLSPGQYTAVFLLGDVVSLIVQAIGGAAAAAAVNMRKNPAEGGRIMLGGIAFQMAIITIYVLCAGEFVLRYLRDWPVRRLASADSTARSGGGRMTPRMKILLYAMMFNTTCLFIRAVYRVIELSNGWTGRIIRTEVYFNVLDGAMITLAMFTLNFAHPGFLLGKDSDEVPPVRRDSETVTAGTVEEAKERWSE